MLKMEPRPRLPEGEVTLRWRTRPDGSIYLEGFTRYPPVAGEDWRRGNDLSDHASFGRPSIASALETVREVLEGKRV